MATRQGLPKPSPENKPLVICWGRGEAGTHWQSWRGGLRIQLPLKQLFKQSSLVNQTHSFPHSLPEVTGASNSWIFSRLCGIYVNQVSSQLSQFHQVNFDSSIDFLTYKIVFLLPSLPLSPLLWVQAFLNNPFAVASVGFWKRAKLNACVQFAILCSSIHFQLPKLCWQLYSTVISLLFYASLFNLVSI